MCVLFRLSIEVRKLVRKGPGGKGNLPRKTKQDIVINLDYNAIKG